MRSFSIAFSVIQSRSPRISRSSAGASSRRWKAEAEDALPFSFGPPRVLKPTFELLGEELLRAGQSEEAATAFKRATERNPGRPLAVAGLEEALAADG